MSMTHAQFTEQANSIATAVNWAKREQFPISVFYHADRGIVGHMAGQRHLVPAGSAWLIDFQRNAKQDEVVARLSTVMRQRGLVRE